MSENRNLPPSREELGDGWSGYGEPFPPYTYIPNRSLPHPRSSPLGHSHGLPEPTAQPIDDDRWADSRAYLRGCRLFNAGYYWEAHEEWEALWHAQGRIGPVAEVLKGLIKLAAAGVKVREGRPQGVASHARRAAESFKIARAAVGPTVLGLDLDHWGRLARDLADHPVVDLTDHSGIARIVFQFRIEPIVLARRADEK